MKRRLFLTGPIGCGKSTAIEKALGPRLPRCGGFLTRRHREPCLHFTVQSPDGQNSKTFLDFSSGKPNGDLSVFSGCIAPGKVLVLDEIGGIELLNPEFAAELEALLNTDIPILGVLKGEGPAGALIRALELTEEYETAAARLRAQLHADPDTLVYDCGQFDEQAFRLAAQWVEEIFHD